MEIRGNNESLHDRIKGQGKNETYSVLVIIFNVIGIILVIFGFYSFYSVLNSTDNQKLLFNGIIMIVGAVFVLIGKIIAYFNGNISSWTGNR